jgi:glutamyl-tRNA synthetase
MLPQLIKLAPLLQERVNNFAEVKKWTDFIFADKILLQNSNMLIAKNSTAEVTLKSLRTAKEIIGQFGLENLEGELRKLALTNSIKASEVFWPIRVAISGKTISLPLFQSMNVLGKEKCLQRIESAIDLIESEHGK